MIRLHHAPGTRSMRTLWLLHELGVEFEVMTRPFDRSLRDADYLALNPAGRVPALEIDGDAMFETGAITEYLCEMFPDAGMGRLPGDPERKEWLIWLHFSETISQHSAALTQQHIALYDDTMRSPIVMKLEAARLQKCYGALEARLAGEGASRDYLLDSGFSAADISCAQAVYMSRHFAHIEPFENLNAWYVRLCERRGFQASTPAEGQGLYGQAFYPAWPV
jgi:glutathione S-transferase